MIWVQESELVPYPYRTSSELYNVVREMVVCMHWGGGGAKQTLDRTNLLFSPVQEACLDDWL